MEGPAREPNSTYERLLQAAQDEFAAAGYAGASMQNIAHATGIRKASLFHYFPSKEALYQAVVKEIFGELAKIFAAANAQSSDPVSEVRGLICGFHDFIAFNPNYSRILFHRILEDQNSVRETSRSLIKPIVDQCANFLRAGIKKGVFRKLDPVDTVLSILGSIVFFYAGSPLVEACTGNKVFSPRTIATRRARVVEQVMAMLTADGTSGAAQSRSKTSQIQRRASRLAAL